MNDFRPAFVRDVRETALAVVVEQLAAVALRHEQIGTAIVVEIAEDGADLAGVIGDAAILRLDETFCRVQCQQARAGAVEEIGPAVAIDVANGQRVALDGAAETL